MASVRATLPWRLSLSHSLALLAHRAVYEAGNGLPLGFLPFPSSLASLPHLLLGAWNKT